MVTIKRIAEDANVSVSTVSIVLGRRSAQLKVSAATQKKVLESAKKLGYCRNLLASQMQSGKTRIFSFLAPEHNDYIMQIFSGVVHQAQQLGFYCKFYEVMRDPEESHRLYYEVLGMRPEAIIIHAALAECNYFLEQANALGIPVACVDRIPERAVQAAVVSDSIEGMVKMVDHLYAMGHRRIGFFSDLLKEGKFSQIRFTAFQKAMLALGLEQKSEWNCSLDYYHNQKIREFLAGLYAGHGPKPTAFCCASDLIALRVLTSLQRLGIRVPEEVSLIGYGGIHFTELTDPSLTTVFQNFEEMGRRGVKYIMDFLNNKTKEHLHLAIPTRILEGESVAAPNKGDRS